MAGRKEKRTEDIKIRIAPSLKKAAAEQAETKGDSLSNYIVKLIKKDLAESENKHID